MKKDFMEHPEVQRVYAIMKKHCPESLAKEAAFGCSLPHDSTPEARILWAKHLCNTLSGLENEEIKIVRMACRCSLKWENIHDAKRLYTASNSLSEFAATARQQLGVRWEAEGDSLFVTYTECSCPMVNQSPELLPPVWCYCTMGYNKDYFSEIFNVDVDVEMLRAIKLGDDTCLMKITRIRHTNRPSTA